MYLAMGKKWLSSLYHTVWRRNVMRSGMVTGLILVGALLGLAVAYRAHMQGNFHKLKLKANITSEQEEAPVPRPGGQEAAVLLRTRQTGDSTPEFLSATMLPGRGMNVLQITAYIPGKGEVNLMASPSVDGAAAAMTGKGADADGQASLTMGGAFEAPWAGRMWGVPAQTAKHMTTVWRGHSMTLPATEAEAADGLMLAQASDSAGTTGLPDGGEAQAVFRAGDYGVHWPSNTEVTVTVLLSSRTIDLTVVARNVGDTAEPIGIGWHPRFAIFGGNRGILRLRVPGEMRAEMRGQGKEQPTGKLLPVAGTPFDFTANGGAKLGTMDLDESFVALHQNLLDNGPAAELSDPASGYGLRMTALSPTIKAMRVVAPANADFVSIGPQYNYPDPFGREWSKDTDSGMVVLQPGQSTEWKVRLELFLVDGTTPTM
jgi:galactose mutarotase-like enzyme